MPQVRRRRAAQRGFRMVASYTGWKWHLDDVSFAGKRNRTVRRPSVRRRTAMTGFGGGRYCRWSARIVDIAAPRLGVNRNEFSARRYRGRTLQNAVTPTALNVARSLDLCCVK
jgi:hypothetical protein